MNFCCTEILNFLVINVKMFSEIPLVKENEGYSFHIVFCCVENLALGKYLMGVVFGVRHALSVFALLAAVLVFGRHVLVFVTSRFV